MISRRASLRSIALGSVAALLDGGAMRTDASAAVTPSSLRAAPPPAPLPDRYDEPLGIGLEGWPYPAAVSFHACAVAGQPLRMAYMDVPPTGPARGRTAVLLHGKNFDSSYWAGPIKDLTSAGYRVIVPDQIGFNKSSKPDIDYSLDLLAELTVNLLAGLQIGRFTLIGHSTGGLLAVRLAAAYPDKVERLVLEDPIGLVAYHRFIPAPSLETLVAAERRQTVASYRAFVRHFFATLPAAQIEPFVEWRMRLTHSGEYERFCKASALTYLMIYREPVRDQIGDIRAPTLMMVGDRDRSTPLKPYASPEMAAKIPSLPSAAAEAAKDLRQGALVVVPGVGHVPHLEAPDAFRKAVLDFLAA